MSDKLLCKYSIGEKAEFSKTISESDVYLFAGITGNMNPLNIDEVKVSQSFSGQRIVHGALLSVLVSTTNDNTMG